ncbi:Reelin domain-containing protein 1 [Lamellibrachia satsuma]|nr:Reelin domain-containing protein 1 [Lamellibrachia satsuma]
MASAAVFTCVVILGLAVGRVVHGYGNGAAHPACTHMRVAHGDHQTAASPYSINLPDSPTKYSAGCMVKLCIRQTTTWRGTLVQARRRDNSNITPVGLWSDILPDNTRLMTCTEEGDSITHANNKPKDYEACFLWNPPAKPVGDVFFIATVATTKDTWWMNLTTSHLSAEEQYDSADSAKCASGASGISVVGRSLMGLLASFAVMYLLK